MHAESQVGNTQKLPITQTVQDIDKNMGCDCMVALPMRIYVLMENNVIMLYNYIIMISKLEHYFSPMIIVLEVELWDA